MMIKWYGDVVNELKPSSVDSFDNNVSFLTFNYDRSFEHYLFLSIKNSYEEIKDVKQCAEIVSSIPIIHLHGQIGKLPWQSNDGSGRQYSESFEEIKYIRKTLSRNVEYLGSTLAKARHYIVNISKQIKIIHEKELDSDDEFQKAKILLNNAENIYFLGFGYHDVNLKRLNISQISPISPKIKRNIDGTSYGIGAAKRKHINSVTNGRINLPEKNYKIIEFLKERVLFE
ncbi:MAG: hypothetical protein HND49_08370 [Planctomycetes bacterium]|nr:hypothetical protein [Planctomycetota bacterium]